MGYIRFAIQNPVKVAVAVLLLLLFGMLSLFAIPIQLTPNVDRPIITVETSWTGRSPQEVEREIIEEQEDKLKGVTNLRKMMSTASLGNASIELEFYIGTDMTRALQEVSDKLREVPEYPDDVDQPVITAADASSENAIAWIVVSSSDPDFDVQGFYDTADKRIKPILERVSGVGEINIYGGRERQVHVQVDPRRLAQRGITFNQLMQALRGENVNVSAGEMDSGRLDVRVRTVGQYDAVEQVEQTIVAYDEGGPVRIMDIAGVELTLEKRRSFVRARGRSALAIQVIRETGSNVMTTMALLRDRIDYINEDVLPTLEPSLQLRQAYDETVYIEDAISLVQGNLLVGGTLAALALLIYLRVWRPTVIIALAIPISIIGTFVIMTALGRNLNVISLAGLAFAVGMVLDNAIVVLENIDRHLLMEKKPWQAAFDATREVWGAIFASTLTTLAVFVPVLTIEEEAGQLFRDISIAICGAVTLSLIVAITVIPSASARFLRERSKLTHGPFVRSLQSLFGLATVLGAAARRFADTLYWLTGRSVLQVGLRIAIVGTFTVASLGGAWLLMPPADYLPSGNQNLVFGMMFNPPGYSVPQASFVADRVEAIVSPYWEAETPEETAELPPVHRAFPPFDAIENIPPIRDFFLVTFRGNMFMGASSQEKGNVAPLAEVLTSAMFTIPGSFGFAQQTSLFGRGLGGTSEIDVEITATDLNELRTVAETLQQQLIAQYGPQSVRSDPQNYNLPGPELQVKIDRVRAADLGIDVASLGLGVQALIDGATVGDYRYQGDSIDLLITRDPDTELTADRLRGVPLATVNRRGEPQGTVPLSAVATIERAEAPQEIKRIEQRRAITLTVTSPPGVPLETLMAQIGELRDQLASQGVIRGDLEVTMSGTADQLTEVRGALLGQWAGWTFESVLSLLTSRMFIALLIVFLLMAALFESFLYPFVIMFAVPLATVGGFAGLAIVHYFIPSQQLDTLTMLGFIILIGIVVNNAILIVHQSLNFMRGLGEGEGDDTGTLEPREAIRAAVRTRIRPIFMTTTTSVFGMLPLVLMPGSGSELYRGLGSVVVGGLIVATMFTLIVVPLLFSLVLDARLALFRMLRMEAPDLGAPPPELA